MIIKTYPEVAKLILPQETKFKNNRAEIKVRQVGGQTIIHLKAKDSSALKAARASVENIIKIFEKTKGVKNGR